MSVKDLSNVTLVYADLSLLLCWEEKVKQGTECSLNLKYSKGKFTSILQCSSTKMLPKPIPSSTSQAENIKKKKKGSKKKMEALITYQKRLVEEKGLPPSKLMLEQAASATTASLPVQMPGLEEKYFKSEHCDKCCPCPCVDLRDIWDTNIETFRSLKKSVMKKQTYHLN